MHADVSAGGEHVRGYGCGLMIIIWDSSGFFRGMSAGTLSVTWRRRCPDLRGSWWISAGDLSASKEGVWPQSPPVPGYLGAVDANDRCIALNINHNLSNDPSKFIPLWEWMWCHYVFHALRQNWMCTLFLVAVKYAYDYKKMWSKHWRTCRDMLWHHIPSLWGYLQH